MRTLETSGKSLEFPCSLNGTLAVFPISLLFPSGKGILAYGPNFLALVACNFLTPLICLDLALSQLDMLQLLRSTFARRTCTYTVLNTKRCVRAHVHARVHVYRYPATLRCRHCWSESLGQNCATASTYHTSVWFHPKRTRWRTWTRRTIPQRTLSRT